MSPSASIQLYPRSSRAKLTYFIVDKLGSVKNWNGIAALLPGRTNKDCRKRWYKVCQGIRKGAWTPEEDQRLQLAVQQVGFKSVAPVSYIFSSPYSSSTDG